MGGVEIQGRVLTPRPLTGRAILALTAAQQEAEDARDVVAGLEAEMQHIGARIDALADAAGEFDREARDRLNQERKELRAALADAQEDLLRGQMLVLLARCEPVDGVDVEWCMDHIRFPEDYVLVMGEADDVPPTSPAPGGGSS